MRSDQLPKSRFSSDSSVKEKIDNLIHLYKEIKEAESKNLAQIEQLESDRASMIKRLNNLKKVIFLDTQKKELSKNINNNKILLETVQDFQKSINKNIKDLFKHYPTFTFYDEMNVENPKGVKKTVSAEIIINDHLNKPQAEAEPRNRETLKKDIFIQALKLENLLNNPVFFNEDGVSYRDGPYIAKHQAIENISLKGDLVTIKFKKSISHLKYLKEKFPISKSSNRSLTFKKSDLLELNEAMLYPEFAQTFNDKADYLNLKDLEMLKESYPKSYRGETIRIIKKYKDDIAKASTKEEKIPVIESVLKELNHLIEKAESDEGNLGFIMHVKRKLAFEIQKQLQSCYLDESQKTLASVFNGAIKSKCINKFNKVLMTYLKYDFDDTDEFKTYLYNIHNMIDVNVTRGDKDISSSMLDETLKTIILEKLLFEGSNPKYLHLRSNAKNYFQRLLKEYSPDPTQFDIKGLTDLQPVIQGLVNKNHSFAEIREKINQVFDDKYKDKFVKLISKIEAFQTESKKFENESDEYQTVVRLSVILKNISHIYPPNREDDIQRALKSFNLLLEKIKAHGQINDKGEIDYVDINYRDIKAIFSNMDIIQKKLKSKAGTYEQVIGDILGEEMAKLAKSFKQPFLKEFADYKIDQAPLTVARNSEMRNILLEPFMSSDEYSENFSLIFQNANAWKQALSISENKLFSISHVNELLKRVDLNVGDLSVILDMMEGHLIGFFQDKFTNFSDKEILINPSQYMQNRYDELKDKVKDLVVEKNTIQILQRWKDKVDSAHQDSFELIYKLLTDCYYDKHPEERKITYWQLSEGQKSELADINLKNLKVDEIKALRQDIYKNIKTEDYLPKIMKILESSSQLILTKSSDYTQTEIGSEIERLRNTCIEVLYSSLTEQQKTNIQQEYDEIVKRMNGNDRDKIQHMTGINDMRKIIENKPKDEPPLVTLLNLQKCATERTSVFLLWTKFGVRSEGRLRWADELYHDLKRKNFIEMLKPGKVERLTTSGAQKNLGG